MTISYPETQHNHNISSWLFSVTFELSLRQRAPVHDHLKKGWKFTAGFYSHHGPLYRRKGLKRVDIVLPLFETLSNPNGCTRHASLPTVARRSALSKGAVDLRKVLLWKQNCSGFERDKTLIPGQMCNHLQDGKMGESVNVFRKKDWRRL